jgi:hypothetical protein
MRGNMSRARGRSAAASSIVSWTLSSSVCALRTLKCPHTSKLTGASVGLRVDCYAPLPHADTKVSRECCTLCNRMTAKAHSS